MKQKTRPKQSRIRGNGIRALFRNEGGLTLEEAVSRSDGANRVMASCERLTRNVTYEEENMIQSFLPCWSSAVMGFRFPKIRMGKTIECYDRNSLNRWVFPVPPEHQDKSDIILVANHPDMSFEVDGHNRVIHSSIISVIGRSKFESSTDPKHRVPNGQSMDYYELPFSSFREITGRVCALAVFADYLHEAAIWRRVLRLAPPSMKLNLVVED